MPSYGSAFLLRKVYAAVFDDQDGTVAVSSIGIGFRGMLVDGTAFEPEAVVHILDDIIYTWPMTRKK